MRNSISGLASWYAVQRPVGRLAAAAVIWVTLSFVLQAVQMDLAAQSFESEQGYLSRSRLLPRLREALSVLGDRMEGPGQEVLTLTGTLLWNSSKESLPFRAIWEFPGRLRIETSTGIKTFDGDTLVGATTRSEAALVETFFYDTAEHFFLSQAGGVSSRFLGTRFRLDDGRNQNYSGPYYDIYEVTEVVRVDGQRRTLARLYYLNSDTLDLERVRYQSNSDSLPTEVEVRVENWQQGDRQKTPGRIVRWEDGRVLFTVSITSAVIAPRR